VPAKSAASERCRCHSSHDGYESAPEDPESVDTNCAATPFLVSSDSVAPPPRRWTGLFPPH